MLARDPDGTRANIQSHRHPLWPCGKQRLQTSAETFARACLEEHRSNGEAENALKRRSSFIALGVFAVPASRPKGTVRALLTWSRARSCQDGRRCCGSGCCALAAHRRPTATITLRFRRLARPDGGLHLLDIRQPERRHLAASQQAGCAFRRGCDHIEGGCLDRPVFPAEQPTGFGLSQIPVAHLADSQAVAARCLVAAGSIPLATSPSLIRASSRACSSVIGPKRPISTRLSRLCSFQNWRIKTFVPLGLTFTPKPRSCPSHKKEGLPFLGVQRSTVRMVSR